MTQRFLPYSPERDVYRLLGVDPRAGNEELREAWRRLARTFHPDRNDSSRSHEEMQVVNALRELLEDPDARARYDRERYRFLASRERRPRTGPPSGLGAPARVRADAPRSSTERLLVAVGAGLRAFALELVPARCERCAGAVGRRDRRCGVCGAEVARQRA